MALYIPAARRRNKLLITGAVAALIGLGAGVGIGRATAPKVADVAAAAKGSVKVVTGQLRSLPLEYDKATADPASRAGFDASLAAGLQRAQDNLDAAFADAPWVDASTRNRLRAGIDAIGAAAAANVPSAEFARAVEDAASTIDAAFGS